MVYFTRTTPQGVSTMITKALLTAAALTALSMTSWSVADSPAPAQPAGMPANAQSTPSTNTHQDLPQLARVHYHTVIVDDLEIFYREASPTNAPNAPVLLLLHGFPTSSQMFRDLLPVLGTKYRVIAPDYPGFGNSSMPSREVFQYTFDNLAKSMEAFVKALNFEHFAVYVQDYGAPIGFRLVSMHPEWITGLIIQNGNAYDEGLDNDFWKPIKAYWADPTPANREVLRPFTKLDATRWQYLHGARDASSISPDAWITDQYGLDRAGNADIQLDLFLDYGTNPTHYPQWQRYFREHQPPALIVWGKRDQIFPDAGAHPYLRDLKNVDFNLLDTGHFALEEEGVLIATKIDQFMQQRVVPSLHAK
jgi:pimeloyl-ACP methyl ester carboxylesterase